MKLKHRHGQDSSDIVFEYKFRQNINIYETVPGYCNGEVQGLSTRCNKSKHQRLLKPPQPWTQLLYGPLFTKLVWIQSCKILTFCIDIYSTVRFLNVLFIFCNLLHISTTVTEMVRQSQPKGLIVTIHARTLSYYHRIKQLLEHWQELYEQLLQKPSQWKL